jgi:hypothetical protein
MVAQTPRTSTSITSEGQLKLLVPPLFNTRRPKSGGEELQRGCSEYTTHTHMGRDRWYKAAGVAQASATAGGGGGEGAVRAALKPNQSHRRAGRGQSRGAQAAQSTTNQRSHSGDSKNTARGAAAAGLTSGWWCRWWPSPGTGPSAWQQPCPTSASTSCSPRCWGA